MEEKLKGRLNPLNQGLVGSLTPKSQRIVGNLNIYTMETGDGRDIELAVVGEYICWRRVNDTKWIQLVPLSDLKGDSPVRGIDYWTEEDKASILDYINQAIGGDIPHNNLIDRDKPDAHPISSITGLEDELKRGSDKSYVHIQKTASESWDIVHNLNKYPSITIVDSANNIVVGDIIYKNLNEVNVKFIGVFSGKAFLN
jgi:hypothetical protein